MAIVKMYAKTVYCHLKKDTLKVTAGQTVKVGQEIAHADNTGLSTGSHLHFALKPIYKGEQDWQWANTEQTNGYYGAIDPLPYMDLEQDPFTKIIKYGQKDTHPEGDVSRLQAFLVRKGFLVMPPNINFGFYAGLTKKAVMNYQISKGIKHNNGIQVGMQTLSALNKDYDL